MKKYQYIIKITLNFMKNRKYNIFLYKQVLKNTKLNLKNEKDLYVIEITIKLILKIEKIFTFILKIDKIKT